MRLVPGFLLVASAMSGCAALQAAIEADYVFDNVNVVPMDHEVVLANRVVAVRDGEIIAIHGQSSANRIKARVRIDGAGQYLIPGLADMHVHIRMDPQAAFNLFLANGVTTVFNMGLGDRNGDVEIDHLQLRRDVARDRAHGEAAAGSLDNYLQAYFSNAERMSDPEYRAPVVRDVAASGVYVVPTLIIYKYILNYVDDDRFAELQADERLAYLPEGTRDAYMSAETNEYRSGFVRVLGEYVGGHDAVVSHTARNVETLFALAGEMQEAGAPMLLGTDVFGAVVPGFAVHEELALLVAAGLTPYEALRTGTVNVAAYLDEMDSRGTKEVGKSADFILVAGNPLADVGHAANVTGVFSHSKWRAAPELAGMLAEAKARSAGDDDQDR